jgi:hypothetical protein
MSNETIVMLGQLPARWDDDVGHEYEGDGAEAFGIVVIVLLVWGLIWAWKRPIPPRS